MQVIDIPKCSGQVRLRKLTKATSFAIEFTPPLRTKLFFTGLLGKGSILVRDLYDTTCVSIEMNRNRNLKRRIKEEQVPCRGVTKYVHMIDSTYPEIIFYIQFLLNSLPDSFLVCWLPVLLGYSIAC